MRSSLVKQIEELNGLTRLNCPSRHAAQTFAYDRKGTSSSRNVHVLINCSSPLTPNRLQRPPPAQRKNAHHRRPTRPRTNVDNTSRPRYKPRLLKRASRPQPPPALNSNVTTSWRACSSQPSLANCVSKNPPSASASTSAEGRRATPVRQLCKPRHLFSLAVVLLLLLVQFFLPRLLHNTFYNFSRTKHIWPATSSCPASPVLSSSPKTCPKAEQQLEFSHTFYTQTKPSMKLADEAKRVAAEFEFPAEGVRKAVKEFIREMG